MRVSKLPIPDINLVSYMNSVCKEDIHLQQPRCSCGATQDDSRDDFVQSWGDWTTQAIEVETPVAGKIKPKLNISRGKRKLITN